MKLSPLPVLLTAALFASCSSKEVEFAADSTGRFHRVGTFTPDESWKRTEERRIDAEIRGERPEAGKKTWREYWHWSYANIRSRAGPPPWKPTAFKSADEMVAYIETQRKARGLPAFDP